MTGTAIKTLNIVIWLVYFVLLYQRFGCLIPQLHTTHTIVLLAARLYPRRLRTRPGKERAYNSVNWEEGDLRGPVGLVGQPGSLA